MTGILRGISNALYLVPFTVARYRRDHPGEQVLIATAVKMVRRERDEEPTRGLHWIVARRAALILSDTQLTCGGLRLPLAEIERTTLIEVRSLLVRGLVVKVATRGGAHYQFGTMDEPAWSTQTALPCVREVGRVRHSAASVVIRLAIVAYVVHRWWTGTL